MTYAEKIVWLRYYERIEANVNLLMEERQRWRQLALRRAGAADAPASGKRRRDGQSPLIRAADMEALIDGEINALAQRRADMRRALDAMTDNRLAELLKRRYIMCMSWRSIARAMSYSESGIFYAHRCAVNMLEV
jgi:hypothetical protein